MKVTALKFLGEVACTQHRDPESKSKRGQSSSIPTSARPSLIQPHDVVEHPDEPQKNYEEDEDGKIVPHRRVQLFVIHRRGAAVGIQLIIPISL